MVEKLGKGWFSEVNDQWPGQATSLEIKGNLLHDKQSKFQHVQVFDSVSNGKVLILDDVIQVTEKDECAYHEMFTHIALFAHENPRRVLVVGGGDGGLLREIAKHPSIEEMVICDIDEMVGQVSKEYMPSVGCGYDDPRVKVMVEDANAYLDSPDLEGYFDVILSDTSDPVGPAEFLFEVPFYRKMYKCLAPGGIVLTQAENIWLTLPLIEKLIKGAGTFFTNVQYATSNVPTYPSGIMGFLCCYKGKKGEKAGEKEGKVMDLSTPKRKPRAKMKLNYYTPRLHKAAFCLPAFAETRVEAARLEVLGFNKFVKAGAAAKKARKAAEKPGSSSKKQRRGKGKEDPEEEEDDEEESES